MAVLSWECPDSGIRAASQFSLGFFRNKGVAAALWLSIERRRVDGHAYAGVRELVRFGYVVDLICSGLAFWFFHLYSHPSSRCLLSSVGLMKRTWADDAHGWAHDVILVITWSSAQDFPRDTPILFIAS